MWHHYLTFAPETEFRDLDEFTSYHPTQWGCIAISSHDDAITNITFVADNHPATASTQLPKSHQLALTLLQTGKLDEPLSLQPQGTEFQRKVWAAISCIPWGSRATYADIAKAINNPSAVRAVGTATGKNPIGLLIPCHRVVPSSGGVGQYLWGAPLKQALLDWESSIKNT